MPNFFVNLFIAAQFDALPPAFEESEPPACNDGWRDLAEWLVGNAP